jgi:hypothetical protein
MPNDRKLWGKFSTVVDVSPELRAKLKKKWGEDSEFLLRRCFVVYIPEQQLSH